MNTTAAAPSEYLQELMSKRCFPERSGWIFTFLSFFFFYTLLVDFLLTQWFVLSLCFLPLQAAWGQHVFNSFRLRMWSVPEHKSEKSLRLAYGVSKVLQTKKKNPPYNEEHIFLQFYLLERKDTC